jgi:PhnB protein
MAKNPPEGYPRICPYLYYEDAAAAIEWLTNAFGFRERMRMPGPDGSVGHAELELDGGVVMLGQPQEARSPKSLETVTSAVHIYVDDVDAHCERAKAAGADVHRALETQFYGDRLYGATDPEGHHWYFAQHVKDVSPEEMEAAAAAMAAG